MKLNRTLASAAALLAFVAVTGSAAAQDLGGAPPPPGPNPWKYDIAFYFWMSDLSGDVAINGVTANGDAAFHDMFDHLESAATIHFEGWDSDQAGFFIDLNAMSYFEDPEFPTGEGSLEVDFIFLEAALASRTRRGQMFMDIFGGLRWVRFESAIEVPTIAQEENARDFFDPMIGLRFGWDATEWLQVMLRMDMAGFGVGTEMTGNLVLTAGFQVSPQISLIGGWRSMGIEIDEDDFVADLQMKGPLVAINFGF